MPAQSGLFGFTGKAVSHPNVLRKWIRLGLLYTLIGVTAFTPLLLFGESIPIFGERPFLPGISLLAFFKGVSGMWIVFSGFILINNFGHWVVLTDEQKAAARNRS